MNSNESRRVFFRDSGWMVASSFLAGLFMFGVHFFAPFMSESEYGLFGALLAMLNLMMIPAIGLQLVFARDAAAALDETGVRTVACAARRVMAWGAVIWLGMAGITVLFSGAIMRTLRIADPMALWMTVALGLPQLLTPVTLGILQGRERFLWLGAAAITNGAGRFISVAVIVVFLGGQAAGAVTGAWLGLVVSSFVAAWHSRDVWAASERATTWDWRAWLGRVAPLTLGLGASQFMFAADMIMVRSFFGEGTGYYQAASMFGRGLVLFTAPVAAVVFPKVVRSHARAQKSNVVTQALLATGTLGVAAALACSLCAWSVPSLLNHLRGLPPEAWFGLGGKLLPHEPAVRQVAGLIPGFVWAMLPFALANILIYDLLARERYRAVPWLLVIAAVYVSTLTLFHASFGQVIAVIGVFALALLGAAIGFSRANPG